MKGLEDNLKKELAQIVATLSYFQITCSPEEVRKQIPMLRRIKEDVTHMIYMATNVQE